MNIINEGDTIKLKFHKITDVERKCVKTYVLPIHKNSLNNIWEVLVPKKDGTYASYEIQELCLKKSSNNDSKYEPWPMNGFECVPDFVFDLYR